MPSGSLPVVGTDRRGRGPWFGPDLTHLSPVRSLPYTPTVVYFLHTKGPPVFVSHSRNVIPKVLWEGRDQGPLPGVVGTRPTNLCRGGGGWIRGGSHTPRTDFLSSPRVYLLSVSFPRSNGLLPPSGEVEGLEPKGIGLSHW